MLVNLFLPRHGNNAKDAAQCELINEMRGVRAFAGTD